MSLYLSVIADQCSVVIKVPISDMPFINYCCTSYKHGALALKPQLVECVYFCCHCGKAAVHFRALCLYSVMQILICI